MKRSFSALAIVAALLTLGFMAQPSYAVGSVTGHVLDADGNGVGGAIVAVMGIDFRRGHMPFMGHTQSADDGSFGFEDVPAGNYVLTAMARQLGGARAQAQVQDDNATDVTLTLQGRMGGNHGGNGGNDSVQVGSLTGTVHDADGNLVAGARVMLMPVRIAMHRGMRMPHLMATTDENGGFSFENLPVGNWVVTAIARGVGAGRARAEIVADQQANVDVVLGQHR